MNTTIKFPTPQPVPAPEKDILTPPGHHPRVAVWLAVGALALTLAINVLAVMVFPLTFTVFGREYVFFAWLVSWKWVGFDLIIFLVAFGAFVIRWQWRMVEKPEDKKLYEKQIETLNAEIASLKAHMPSEPNKGLEYQVYAYKLAFKAIAGQDTTRPAKQQTEHGKALEMLRALGLYAGEGKGAKFTTHDPEKIAHHVLKLSSVDPDRFWISQPNGSQNSWPFKK